MYVSPWLFSLTLKPFWRGNARSVGMTLWMRDQIITASAVFYGSYCTHAYCSAMPEAVYSVVVRLVRM